MTMLIESIKRHQLWNMMPWDPGECQNSCCTVGVTLLQTTLLCRFLLQLQNCWKGAPALYLAFALQGHGGLCSQHTRRPLRSCSNSTLAQRCRCQEWDCSM